MAMTEGLKDSAKALSDHSLHWFSDSSNTVCIIKRGSMKPHLHALALKIFDLTKSHDITLSVSWISRNQNKEADLWSRVVDYDDWQISNDTFANICSELDMWPTIVNLECRILSFIYHPLSCLNSGYIYLFIIWVYLVISGGIKYYFKLLFFENAKMIECQSAYQYRSAELYSNAQYN